VKVNSVFVASGPVVRERGSVVKPARVVVVEALSLVSAVNVNVSAADMLGPECEPAEPLVKVGPQLRTGSVDEVSCSAEEFFAILSEASVGPVGLLAIMPEVRVCVVKSTGPSVQVMDPVVEAPDPVFKI